MGEWTRNLGKVAYAYDSDELVQLAAGRLDAVGDVLVQEFVAGEGIGLCGFMLDGTLHLPFQWRRIPRERPGGSGSDARQSLALDSTLKTAAEQLLRTARFEGLAMVEFKRTFAKRDHVLMEINGRPRGDHSNCPSVVESIIRVALVGWLLEGRRPAELIAYKVGLTAELTAELSHLESVWGGKPAGWPLSYPRFLSHAGPGRPMPWYPGLHYDDLSLSDPRPGLAKLSDWVRVHVRGTGR